MASPLVTMKLPRALSGAPSHPSLKHSGFIKSLRTPRQSQRANKRQLATKVVSELPAQTENLTLAGPPGGPFKVAEGQLSNVLAASPQALLRLGSGRWCSKDVATYRRPEQPIIIYEFEGCPFCRKVREVTAWLDLDVLYYPCPQGSPTWRPKAIGLSGKSQFPFMVDPNTGRQMLESGDIIKYLCDEYGGGEPQWQLQLGVFTTLTAGLGMLPRVARGSRYRPSRLPEKPLELWGYEPSPFSKLVREVLVELELPHIYHPTAVGSANREALVSKWNAPFQVPYLEDPNNAVAYYESDQIIKYLEETYSIASM